MKSSRSAPILPLRRNLAVSAAVLACSAMIGQTPLLAAPASPLSTLAGSWQGAGTARFEGGKSERLACRGNYTVKSSGAVMGIAIRCASASAKLDLRSALAYNGGKIDGSWEERTFNASGGVTGRASKGRLNLFFSGGVSGSMSVTFSNSSQSVSIKTTGSGLHGVSVSLRRN